MAKSAKPTKNRTATIHDQKMSRGEGGELHQTAEDLGTEVMTTAQGGPISDDQNTLKIGPRGPALIEDFHFREKIFHFDHERIPERVVHARGYGAHGFSKRPIRWRSSPAPICSSASANALRRSCASPLLLAARARSI